MYFSMILSIGGVQRIPKRLKLPLFPIFGDFESFWKPLYIPNTEYHKEIHTEYALHRWNPLPHNQLILINLINVQMFKNEKSLKTFMQLFYKNSKICIPANFRMGNPNMKLCFQYFQQLATCRDIMLRNLGKRG